MDWLIGLALVVALFLIWFVRGLTNDRIKEKDAQLEELGKALDENIEADNAGPDSDLDKRVREQFGRR